MLFPVKARMDSLGRIVVPKALRDALGLSADSVVDISQYGDGLRVIPDGRTARLVESEGGIVADADTPVTDEMVFDLLEAGRR